MLGGGLRLGKGCLAGGPLVLDTSVQYSLEGTPGPLTVVLGADDDVPLVVVTGWILFAALTAGALFFGS